MLPPHSDITTSFHELANLFAMKLSKIRSTIDYDTAILNTSTPSNSTCHQFSKYKELSEHDIRFWSVRLQTRHAP